MNIGKLMKWLVYYLHQNEFKKHDWCIDKKGNLYTKDMCLVKKETKLEYDDITNRKDAFIEWLESEEE